MRIPDKAKPSVKKGRKATGLVHKIAGLPKDVTFGMRGFLLLKTLRAMQPADVPGGQQQN